MWLAKVLFEEKSTPGKLSSIGQMQVDGQRNRDPPIDRGPPVRVRCDGFLESVHEILEQVMTRREQVPVEIV